MKILVIEDETKLRENIVRYLSGDGNICESADTVKVAINKLVGFKYDCILLDIGLPDGDGFVILEFLKTMIKEEAVIIISARDSLQDKLQGLTNGADDYMTKPFHLAELKARIMAIFRRKNAGSNNQLIFNEIGIDLLGREVNVHGIPVLLTRKEYDMLLYFMANKGRVISKNAIAEHLWGDEMDLNDNFDFLYTHIKNLRKKLIDASCSDYIKSVYGIGYKFTN